MPTYPFDAVDPAAQPPAEDPGWFGGESLGSQAQKAAMLALGLGAAGPVMRGIGKIASPFTKAAVGAGVGGGLGLALTGNEAAADPAAADPAAAGADPDVMMFQQLQNDLKETRTKLDQQTNGLKDPATGKWVVKPGKGPDYTDLIKREQTILQQLEPISARISSKSQFQQDEAHASRLADEQATTNNWRIGGGAVGALGGGLMSALAAGLTRGRAGKFANVAGKIDEAMKGVPEGEAIAGTKVGDRLTGLVDEAHTLRGQPAPFSKIDEAKTDWRGNPKPFAPASGKSQGMGDTFEKPMSFGAAELALPGAGLADFAGMQAMRYTTDDPAQDKLYDNASQAGLGFAVGSKLGRLLTKQFSPLGAAGKLKGGEAAAVKEARTRVVRDTQRAGSGFSSKAPAPPPAAPVLPAPPKAPGKQTMADRQKLLSDAQIARGAHNQALSDEKVAVRLSQLAGEGKSPRQAIAAIRNEMGVSVPFRTFSRHYGKATAAATKQAREATELTIARHIVREGPGGGYELHKLAGSTSSAAYKRAMQSALAGLKQSPEFAKMTEQDLVKVIRRTARKIVGR